MIFVSIFRIVWCSLVEKFLTRPWFVCLFVSTGIQRVQSLRDLWSVAFLVYSSLLRWPQRLIEIAWRESLWDMLSISKCMINGEQMRELIFLRLNISGCYSHIVLRNSLNRFELTLKSMSAIWLEYSPLTLPASPLSKALREHDITHFSG